MTLQGVFFAITNYIYKKTYSVIALIIRCVVVNADAFKPIKLFLNETIGCT